MNRKDKKELEEFKKRRHGVMRIMFDLAAQPGDESSAGWKAKYGDMEPSDRVLLRTEHNVTEKSHADSHKGDARPRSESGEKAEWHMYQLD